ncbi:MAG: helix-hairpin-helix domain-containing protein [Thermoanaerobaculales bacterium]
MSAATLDRRTAARTLREIAALLEIGGENVHRVRAFSNAARAVERVEGDLDEMVAGGEITQVRGIGRGTATVLEELAAGKRPAVLDGLTGRIPAGVREMLGISGLGPKKVRSLWQELGLVSVGELEYACRENRLVELKGFGGKTQERLLEAIEFTNRARERRLVHEAWDAAAEIEAELRGLEGIDRVDVAGELRRRCETVGGLELVVTAVDGAAVGRVLEERLQGLRKVEADLWEGATNDGFPLRIMVASPPRAAAALLWATGSPSHLQILARRAEAMGLRLREDGLWLGPTRIDGPGEMGLYEALGCAWVPPEMREDGSEVEAAAGGILPELVTLDALRGALHNHTTDSDGAATVEEMAAAARKLGWSFLGIADHSPVARYANGIDAERLRSQWRRIDEINRTSSGFRVVKGLEADILTDGSLDIPEGCEEGLEYVVASVHSGFQLAREEQTERLIRAVSNPACRILGHPTGRLLLARPGYPVDLERVLEACARHGVAVEINASPFRLDLEWRWARRAIELGVQLVVNPDAHAPGGLADVRWGVAVARKAGATTADLINCHDIGAFLDRR